MYELFAVVQYNHTVLINMKLHNSYIQIQLIKKFKLHIAGQQRSMLLFVIHDFYFLTNTQHYNRNQSIKTLHRK